MIDIDRTEIDIKKKDIFLNFDIYKLNILIQISLMIGNLYSAGLITDYIKNKQK